MFLGVWHALGSLALAESAGESGGSVRTLSRHRPNVAPRLLHLQTGTHALRRLPSSGLLCFESDRVGANSER